MINKKNRQIIFLKYLLGFRLILYFLITSCIFATIFIYPVINDYLINEYSSITGKYDNKIFSSNFKEAINIVMGDWKNYLNPLSNYFIRFFLAAVFFSLFYEKTKKCLIEYKKIK